MALILAVVNVKSTVKVVDPRTGWVFVVGTGAFIMILGVLGKGC